MTSYHQSHLFHLVNLLKDGTYHNGTTLGRHLAISRSAVWKIIQKLKNHGVAIQTRKRKGYLLKEPLYLLDPHKISSPLAPCKLLIFESIDSTNAYIKKMRPGEFPLICLAEAQRQGKGRLNRTWHSPFAHNIYFSCGYSLKIEISELAGLSLVIALVVHQTLKTFGLDQGLKVKWPNDVVYHHKKIAGILLEILAEPHDNFSHVIIGIGINVNVLRVPKTLITKPWTSMQKILHQHFDRNDICKTLIINLFTTLKQFEKTKFAGFKAAWLANDYLLNKKIVVANLKEKLTGAVKSIDNHGRLLLQLKDGTLRAIASGDITIQKMNRR